MKKREIIKELRNLPLKRPGDTLDHRIYRMTERLEALPSSYGKNILSRISIPVCAGATAAVIACCLLLTFSLSSPKRVKYFVVLNEYESQLFNNTDQPNSVFHRENATIVSLIKPQAVSGNARGGNQ